MTYNDPALLSHLDLTVRHVDLRTWMRHHYPDEKPEFLFDPVERLLHPSISIDMLQTLIVEREVLRATCTSYKHSLEELQRAHDTLRREHTRLSAQHPDSELSSRAETAYLNIIGAMLKLMLGQSPSGKPYSQFRSQEAIISALTAHHSTLMGVAERTLQVKFAQANRRLAQAA
ncbi:hypothetical protein GHR37_02470 [Achromobacter xylosoxidans]|nr:hypothetical protein [Achromobacter xylosoxidans]